MKITVIGAGNIGTLITGLFSKKGHEVVLYSRKPEKFSNSILIIDEDDSSITEVANFTVTSNLKESLFETDLVVVTIPSFAINKLMKEVCQYLDPLKTKVLFYPGTGGVEFSCKQFIENGGVIYGTQRVCSVARLKEYGKSVTTSGKRSLMYVGAIPNNYANDARNLIESLFDINTESLPNYLSVTLTPSNPVLHTTRLYSLFKDNKTDGYDSIPLFYEQWNDDSSEILVAVDKEVQSLCKSIPLDLTNVKSLLEHYESKNAKELTKKITSINSFKGLKTPSVEVDGRWYPDFNSRYFTADFPYGLLILKAFCLICKLNTKNIDIVLRWYQETQNKEYINELNQLGKDSISLSIPQNYGINTIEEILDFYK